MVDYFWKYVPALCPDGKVRKVRARHHVYDGSMAADTYFSVPASMVYKGKSVRGFITASAEPGHAKA